MSVRFGPTLAEFFDSTEGGVQGMKATLLLRRDHDTLRSLFGQLRKPTRGNGRTAYFEQLRQEFGMHAQIERELFYPELRNTPSTRAHELVETALRQHEEIDKLIDNIVQHSASGKVDDQIAAFFERAEEHLEFEEDEIFEEARQQFSEYRMEELGLEMEERRRLLQRAA